MFHGGLPSTNIWAHTGDVGGGMLNERLSAIVFYRLSVNKSMKK
jgi:hypothetical protein